MVQLMQAYVFGTFYAAASTLLRYQLAHQTYYQRYAVEGFDPTDFALTLALSIPISYGLALRTKGRMAALYWAQSGLVALAILLSASRTGFLASCVAAAIVPLTFAYSRTLLAIYIGGREPCRAALLIHVDAVVIVGELIGIAALSRILLDLGSIFFHFISCQERKRYRNILQEMWIIPRARAVILVNYNGLCFRIR